jgi:sugar-phosphatase
MTTKNKVCIECDAILFDLDGVLIDSTECIERHWREWADRHNIDIGFVLQNAHGVRTIETMKQVAPHLDLEKEAQAFTDNEIEDTEGVEAIQGSREIIQNLPNHQWAIVTSGSYELVKARMRSANLPFPIHLVTADDVRNGKPSPEPYLTGAKKFGLTPGQCVVVEDSPIGVQSGKAAGMKVIGVLSTHNKTTLLEAGADFIISDLENIQITSNRNNQHLTILLFQPDD